MQNKEALVLFYCDCASAHENKTSLNRQAKAVQGDMTVTPCGFYRLLMYIQ